MKPFIRRFIEFIRITEGRGTLLEAVFWLGLARLALLLVPFRRLAVHLGTPSHETPAQNLDQAATERARTVGGAVQRAARNLPWDCRCMAQALAGKAMLRRRGLPSTLYLGVAKDEAADLCAHAWLRCGDAVITGGEGADRFTVLSTFGDTRDGG